MAELNKPGEQRVEQVSNETKFLLVCVTCYGKTLMEAPEPLEQNQVLRTIANITAVGHIEAYSQPHHIELIDIQNMTSTQYPGKYSNKPTNKSSRSILLPPIIDY